MQIAKDEIYLKSLQNIMEYIAVDSVNRALIFNSELNDKLGKIDNFPYKCGGMGQILHLNFCTRLGSSV